MADIHVQMLVDVVVPESAEPFIFLSRLIDDLNHYMARKGLQETAWVAALPEDRL